MNRPSSRLPADIVVPDNIGERDQWVLWRHDERNGRAFEAVTHEWRSAPNFYAGPGFVFSPDDPFAGLTLTTCLTRKASPNRGRAGLWSGQALEAIRVAGNRGYNYVVDADTQGYFDNIQRETLLELLKERISDRRVLKLIRQWLEAGVMEDGTVKETLAGTPQGKIVAGNITDQKLRYRDRSHHGASGGPVQPCPWFNCCVRCGTYSPSFME